MTDITTQLKALSDASSGDIYDAEFDGGSWMIEAVQTHETFEQFIDSSANWVERSSMKRGTIGGIPFIVWKNMQPRKGAQRRSLAVLDFGDVRYAIDHSMGDWTE